MHKFLKIVGCILAIIGLAHVVKHIIHCKECRGLRGWHKIKVEEEKPTGETVSHKIEVEEEKNKVQGTVLILFIIELYNHKWKDYASPDMPVQTIIRRNNITGAT